MLRNSYQKPIRNVNSEFLLEISGEIYQNSFEKLCKFIVRQKLSKVLARNLPKILEEFLQNSHQKFFKVSPRNIQRSLAEFS